MHLLRFDSDAAARAAFGDLIPSDERPAPWPDGVMPVALVTADEVLDLSGEETVVISPRQQLAGFWLLAATGPDLPGIVAEIEPETGRIAAGDQTLAGARLDPVWAGGEAMLSFAGAEAEMEPVPTAISDRQFAQQLAILGVITEAEALAWAARGELPAALEVALADMPEGERFGARMLLAAATTYERQHPLVAQLGAALDYDEPALDALWRAAAQL